MSIHLYSRGETDIHIHRFLKMDEGKWKRIDADSECKDIKIFCENNNSITLSLIRDIKKKEGKV